MMPSPLVARRLSKPRNFSVGDETQELRSPSEIPASALSAPLPTPPTPPPARMQASTPPPMNTRRTWQPPIDPTCDRAQPLRDIPTVQQPPPPPYTQASQWLPVMWQQQQQPTAPASPLLSHRPLPAIPGQVGMQSPTINSASSPPALPSRANMGQAVRTPTAGKFQP